MEASQIGDYAHRLYAAHGDAAEHEAALKAQAAKSQGRSDEARDWSRIRAAIRQLRGANQG